MAIATEEKNEKMKQKRNCDKIIPVLKYQSVSLDQHNEYKTLHRHRHRIILYTIQPRRKMNGELIQMKIA